ncbi:UNVERIFIED_CONTAM: hypothetical protein HDU68_008275 [Siphonaria sp. JEL0065]|nr:hypothetical protein HDU68_008275 [Siphonaria sp. JEL0065]
MESCHQDPSFEDPTAEANADGVPQKPDARVGLVTAVVRTVAVQGSMFFMGAAKGLLKWFFRMPVKLFRPYAVNPYLVIQSLAAQDGKTMNNPQYLRHLVKSEGLGVLSRNIAPLLVINSLIGAFLFNTYNFSTHALESIAGPNQNSPTSVSFNWIPFASGWIAGASQSIFSTPVDNMQRSLSTDSILAHRHARGGIMSLILSNLKDLAKSAASPLLGTTTIPKVEPETLAKKSTVHHYSDRVHHYRTHIHAQISPYKPLFQNFGQSCLKDSLGFALFFGLFENTRDFGKLAVDSLQDLYRPEDATTLHPIMKGVTITGPQALAVVAAGGLAGMGFQAVSYPIDRINAEMQGRGHPHPKEGWVHTVKRMGGIREVYRGIGPQFARVVPASAVGLFVFEIVNEYLGP